jgi:hypothetical protein
MHRGDPIPSLNKKYAVWHLPQRPGLNGVFHVTATGRMMSLHRLGKQSGTKWCKVQGEDWHGAFVHNSWRSYYGLAETPGHWTF